MNAKSCLQLCLSVRVLMAYVGIYVAGLQRPYMGSAYQQYPPSASCYTTAEKLHVQLPRESRHISQAAISKQLHRARSLSPAPREPHTNFRVAGRRESMAQAWRCHPATPPSFKTPQVLHAMALGDGCLRGLSLGGTRFLTACCSIHPSRRQCIAVGP